MLRQRLTLTGPLVAGLLFATSAVAQETPDPTPPPRGTTSFLPLTEIEKQPLTPTTFVVRAAISNMSEIELGELAAEKSSDPAVTEFAEQLVSHHRQANEELKALAAAQNVALPGTVDEDRQKLHQQLEQLEGEEFDSRYIEAMAEGHDKAVALFESASQSEALPANMKEYASESLSKLQQHRESADALKAADGR